MKNLIQEILDSLKDAPASVLEEAAKAVEKLIRETEEVLSQTNPKPPTQPKDKKE